MAGEAGEAGVSGGTDLRQLWRQTAETDRDETSGKLNLCDLARSRQFSGSDNIGCVPKD